jgi:hypothetical protein
LFADLFGEAGDLADACIHIVRIGLMDFWMGG